MYGQTNLGCAFERLTRNCLAAPCHVLEQPSVGLLEAEEIVTAVGRGAENGAVAGARQQLGGLYQQGRRQSRTVGIEHHGTVVTKREKLLDGGEQAIAEIRMPRLDETDRGRQNIAEEGL